ncbi:MAG: DUF2851 family protein [Mariniphaga sp.]|nr:DUF2851 family protein [Mariniphaga sp.]
MLNHDPIPEEFLQYIWENKLLNTEGITTVNLESIEIIDVGKQNSNSGPDFFNARIKIGDTEWVGNIEIHKKSSDWYSHNHHTDKAYDNVILHVVEQYDKPILTSSGSEIPTLILQYPERIKTNYKRLLFSKTWIACEEQFHKIDQFALKLGYHRLMIERLESKTTDILQSLSKNQNNWNETFYQFLAKMFGFKVNALPFEMLAKSLPLSILSKHKSNLQQIEAMLFGNAGLLNEQLLGDDYYLQLREEYSFLYKKYKLKGIESHLWKFMRLRPVNFPTVRIAQFACLINKSEALFSKILEIEKLEEIQQLFNVTASEYWRTHYRFNKLSKSLKKELGAFSINTLIINVVVPFLFVFGEDQLKNNLKDRALDFLEKLPQEKNSIIDNWEKLGIKVRSAFETQALLQLKNLHCDQKKCLNCQIGNKLVNL